MMLLLNFGALLGVSCSERLMQALIITHELTKSEDMDQYLAQKMKPMVPLLVYGRSARAAPTCAPNDCLWYGWRDR